MKKTFTILLAAIMVMACAVPAFAESTNVSYNVDPSYTVAIPDAVTLGDTAVTADITASDVIMEDGKQIKVDLTAASNTASGSTFNAKNGDSTVTYTITGDEAIAVGDTVATFTADGSKTLTFSAADKSAATVAGAHTETLTFTISMEEKKTDLSTLTADYTAQDGDVLTGTIASNNKITVASGATVTLKNVNISGVNNNSYKWAGITCDGDATLILEGENTVKGFAAAYPGIYVPEGSTLTIKGNGSLDASSNGAGAGIGGGNSITCGNIVIEGGTITATGGADAAGIGSGRQASCGDIIISGGTITATCDSYAAGIGSGKQASCGDITISGGTIAATGGYDGAGIGSGKKASCGDIAINGGTVTAFGGGEDGAGIGGGISASCGDITIQNTVTKVTAKKGFAFGDLLPRSIGKGGDTNSSCGTVTIGGTVYVDGISDSPYTYQP